MKRADATDEIVAALLWDVPRLRAGSRSARDFASALPGELDRWWAPKKYDDDPLGTAAHGVAYERANDLEQAADLYRHLTSGHDPWVHLLGLMLRAWSASEEGLDVIGEARVVVEELSLQPELDARLLSKLATNAFDAGAPELARDLLTDAIAAAPPNTRLHGALAIEGLNAGLPFEWSDAEHHFPPDPLVEYPWIEYDALAAAQSALSTAVEAQARGLWTVTWRTGTTPLNEVVGAEVQATWAGALWLRRPIRKQLGAQLLMGAASAPQQWAYGVIMWALGAGDRPERAYALAEPRLDQESSDLVVRTLGEADIRSRVGHRFLSVAVESWDGLSDETLRWAISLVDPVAGDHPDAALAQRLWAGFAARLEQEWQPRFRALTKALRVAQIETLGVDAVKHLSAASRALIFAAAATAVQEDPTVSTQLLRVLATASPTSLDVKLRNAVSEKAPADAIAHLAYDGHAQMLRSQDLARALETLLAAVHEESEEARGGKVSFGSSDVRLALGRLVAGSPHRGREAIELLIETATDPGLPGEHIMYARMALVLTRRAGQLNDSDLDLLQEADDAVGTIPEHGNISVALLRIRRLNILALRLTSQDAIWVVGACRHEDPRVRQIALATAGEAISASSGAAEREALSWAMIGGLFDPEDDVVRAALSAVDADFLQGSPAAGQVAIRRLPRLLVEGSVPLRTTVAALAQRWADADAALANDPTVRSLLAQAKADRSWIVRTADR